MAIDTMAATLLSSLGNGKHVTHNTQALSFCFSFSSLAKLPSFICPCWKIRLDFSIFQLVIAPELIPWLLVLIFASGIRENPCFLHTVGLSLQSAVDVVPLSMYLLEVMDWNWIRGSMMSEPCASYLCDLAKMGMSCINVKVRYIVCEVSLTQRRSKSNFVPLSWHHEITEYEHR